MRSAFYINTFLLANIVCGMVLAGPSYSEFTQEFNDSAEKGLSAFDHKYNKPSEKGGTIAKVDFNESVGFLMGQLESYNRTENGNTNLKSENLSSTLGVLSSLMIANKKSISNDHWTYIFDQVFTQDNKEINLQFPIQKLAIFFPKNSTSLYRRACMAYNRNTFSENSTQIEKCISDVVEEARKVASKKGIDYTPPNVTDSLADDPNQIRIDESQTEGTTINTTDGKEAGRLGLAGTPTSFIQLNVDIKEITCNTKFTKQTKLKVTLFLLQKCKEWKVFVDPAVIEYLEKGAGLSGTVYKFSKDLEDPSRIFQNYFSGLGVSKSGKSLYLAPSRGSQ